MLFSSQIIELQDEFLKRLSRHELPAKHCVPSLLFKLIECDNDLLDFTLGKIGHKLRLFAEHVDFQHPEIISVFDSLIAQDRDFEQQCMELILLGQFAREHNLKKIIPELGKVLINKSSTKIDVPFNKMHVRILKDDKEREEIRLTKRMQVIDLYSIYKNGEEEWKVQPDNFTKFLRFDSAYKEDIEIAEKKAKRYEELGCTSLAVEVHKSIEIFREHMDQSYYGFNRITMTTAAIILAKSLGYTYQSNKNDLNWFANSKIVVDRKFFGKYDFDPEQIMKFSPFIRNSAKLPVFLRKNQDSYEYEPRVYPLHDFLDFSENVNQTISILEKFPDAGHKPIFDHFGVIVPGIAFPFEKQNVYSVLDDKGIKRSFSCREEAVKTLDKIFMKNKYFHGVLIGEKDNKCYFISYLI